MTTKRSMSVWRGVAGCLLAAMLTGSPLSAQENMDEPLESTEPGSGLSLNFKDTEIREVLNILAYKGNVNITAGEDVTALVTMQLKDVSWDRALDVILRTYNFTYKREKNLIRVMSLSRSQEEENKVPLVTRILMLNFADVDKLKESLQKILGSRGNIQIDERTNALIVTDIPENVARVEEAANALDARTPQVLIEAMMVDVKLTDEDRLGVAWSAFNRNAPIDPVTGKPLDIFQSQTDLSINAGQKTTGLLSFTPVLDNIDIISTIEAWQSSKKAQILANPKIITLNNLEAKIEILEEIPYVETVLDPSGSGTKDTVSFKEAGIKLSVTPQITSGGYISMNIRPEQSFQAGQLLNQPIIEKRRAETNLLVRNGQTIVIGGLRKRDEQKTNEQVPFLGSIPVLGALFRRTMTQTSESELLLFVTPRIVYEHELTPHQQQWLDMLEQKPRLTMDDRTERQKIKDWWQRRSRAIDDSVRAAQEQGGVDTAVAASQPGVTEETPPPAVAVSEKPVRATTRQPRRERRPPRQVQDAEPAVLSERESAPLLTTEQDREFAEMSERARQLLRELEQESAAVLGK